jgi:predicted enzyme related to lactoylglutathione lyase
MSNHPIVHVDIPAEDTTAASKFYSELFGWEDIYSPDFDYHMFQTEPNRGGGFVKVGEPMPYKIGEVIVYFNTDDIDATLAKVEALGGKTLQPKTEIPGIGWFAFFADISGNRLALYTAAQQQS